MAGDKNSRTEKPTPKKLRKARQEGQIPKSQELASWGTLLVVVFLLEITARLAASQFPPLFDRSEAVMSQPEMGPALQLFGQWLLGAGIVLAPMLGGTMVLGLAINFAQVGWAPSGKLLKPKMARVSPAKGLKRLFSSTTLWESGKALFKVAVLTVVTVRAVLDIVPLLVESSLSPLVMTRMVGERAVRMVRNVAVLGLVLAAADYAFQRRKTMAQLRMTKHEVKEEHKDNEGDPHLKGLIRSKQLAMSRNRMMAQVATADVVVVNPTHVSVALAYDASSGPPRVVAKGADLIAATIRERAAEHDVPIVEDVPLARTLFRACEVGDVIPTELYDAVARVLAFIFGLRRRGVSLEGVQQMPQPAMAS